MFDFRLTGTNNGGAKCHLKRFECNYNNIEKSSRLGLDKMFSLLCKCFFFHVFSYSQRRKNMTKKIVFLTTYAGNIITPQLGSDGRKKFCHRNLFFHIFFLHNPYPTPRKDMYIHIPYPELRLVAQCGCGHNAVGAAACGKTPSRRYLNFFLNIGLKDHQ